MKTQQNDLYLGHYTDEMLFEFVENMTNKNESSNNTYTYTYTETNTNNNNNNNINSELLPIIEDQTPKTVHFKLGTQANRVSNSTTKPYSPATTFDQGLKLQVRPFIKHKQTNLLSNKKHNDRDHFDVLTIKKFQQQCPSCNNDSNGIKVIDGKIICINCGRVISIKLDNHMENRTFGKEDNSFTPNAGYTLVSTSMFSGYVNTNVVGTSAFNLMNKLNLWNTTMTADEKNILKSYKQIREVCNRAGFSKKIEDTTKSLYLNLKKCVNSEKINEANKRKINREDKQSVMVAICLLKACSMHEDTHNKYKIAQLCNVDIKAFTKGEKLYLEIIRESEIDAQLDQPVPHELVPRLCKNLKIPDNYRDVIVSTCKNIEILYASSNSAPQTLAATAIYIIVSSYKLPVSIEDIASNSYMAHSTIDKCYKKMSPYLAIVINTEASKILARDIADIIENMPIPAKFEAVYNRIKHNPLNQNR